MPNYHEQPYDDRASLIDFGFVSGYFNQLAVDGHVNDECEWLWNLIDRAYTLAVRGRLHDLQSPEEASRALLFSLGEILGRTWHIPISNAVSEALDRIMHHHARHTPMHKGEPESQCRKDELNERISNKQRNELVEMAISGAETLSAESAKQIGASLEGVVKFWNHFGSIDREEADQILANHTPDPTGQSAVITQPAESTPEPARGHRKAPFDGDLASVKADHEAGLSPGAIGRKWGCSGQHIRNFLTRHGIDPRRSAKGTVWGPASPEAVSRTETSVVAEDAAAVETDQPDLDAPGTPEQPDPTPETPTHSIPIRPAPALTAEDSDVLDAEWPDIQRMLATGSSREKIAGDYDVTVAELNAFIDRKIREVRERIAAKEAAAGLGEA